MFKLFAQSVRQTILWTVIAGLAYPVIVTVIAQTAFRGQANGSQVERGGRVVGSALLAQQFQGSNYFWPRPSACGYGTGPSGLVASGASNLGPTSGALKTNVMNNAAAFLSGNNLSSTISVPADMVYASASGFNRTSAPPQRACKSPAWLRRAVCARTPSRTWWRNLSKPRNGVFWESRASTCCS